MALRKLLNLSTGFVRRCVIANKIPCHAIRDISEIPITALVTGWGIVVISVYGMMIALAVSAGPTVSITNAKVILP